MDIQLQLNGKCVCAIFTQDSLTWSYESNALKLETIKSEYILDVTTRNTAGNSCTLDVHYIEERHDRTLRNCVLQFSGSEENCTTLKDQIQNYIQNIGRPKRLLVFINPNGGKKRAKKVYKKYAEPLFKLFNIKIDYQVTSRPKEARDILQTYDLSNIDGVVAIGGDGFYCECMNGLILARQAEARTNVHDPESTLTECSLPIGIIPAGSGDVIVQYLHGTRDVTTAVLRIVLGRSVQTNAASIHEGGQLISYSGLVLGFGLFGDMMYDCEQFRWMGPYRYEVIPLKTMLTKRRVVDVEVEYLPAYENSKFDRGQLFGRQLSCPAKYDSGLKKRRQRMMSTPDIDFKNTEWKKTDGKVYAVDTYPISMKEKSGKMAPHFGDDALTMLLTDKCSLAKHVTQLKMVKDEKPECYDFDFVRKIRVKGYRVRLPRIPMTTDESGQKHLTKSYYINCDGDFIRLDQPQFEVRIHSKVSQLFGSVAD